VTVLTGDCDVTEFSYLGFDLIFGEKLVVMNVEHKSRRSRDNPGRQNENQTSYNLIPAAYSHAAADHNFEQSGALISKHKFQKLNRQRRFPRISGEMLEIRCIRDTRLRSALKCFTMNILCFWFGAETLRFYPARINI